MQHRFRPVALLLGVVASLAAGLAPAASLDSLVVVAMHENPRLQSLESTWRAALERVPRAAALPDPMLEWKAEASPLRRPAPGNASSQKFALSQMLMFPGKRGAMRSGMQAEAEMAKAQLDRARLEVAAELHRAYYDLYLLFESADILETDRETLHAMAEVARTKYTVGSAMQQDLLKTNVELAMEENRLAIFRARIPAAMARINAILNRPLDASVERPVLGDTTATWPGWAALEETALTRQPMLRMKDQAIAKGESDRRLAGKAGWPDLTVGVEYMAERDMEDAVTWMAGINLPIWRRSRVASAKREADQALAAARADRLQTGNEAAFMVRDAYTMATTMRSQVALYRDAVLPQAEQALGSTRATYETNGTEFMMYLDTQRSLLQARLMYVEALAEFMKARAELGLAVGEPTLLGVKDE
jgi:cobalt-zinc-cadmium efflux system outer membrane protein